WIYIYVSSYGSVRRIYRHASFPIPDCRECHKRPSCGLLWSFFSWCLETVFSDRYQRREISVRKNEFFLLPAVRNYFLCRLDSVCRSLSRFCPHAGLPAGISFSGNLLAFVLFRRSWDPISPKRCPDPPAQHGHQLD